MRGSTRLSLAARGMKTAKYSEEGKKDDENKVTVRDSATSYVVSRKLQERKRGQREEG